jgi:glyoxylase-like metal-dependent hydrolase (beta-lactamase superfamily II)
MACNTQQIKKPDSWCNQKPRAQFSSLKEVHTSHPWFKVYNVGKDVLAIAEPYNYQEVISYLITGKDKALLFDTGMGLDTISAVVKELTSLPVTVINSHTHYDHIGGNAEFNTIIAMNTPYTINNAQHGWPHELVRDEVTPQAICLGKLYGLDTAAYHIRPFKISQLITDGHKINLGGREIEIMAVPGHAPDAIALLDGANGYLFTGDTFYEGPIYLFTGETDVKAYRQSVAKLALLEPHLKMLYTSHNTPLAQPRHLVALRNAFEEIMDGKIKGVDAEATQAYGFAKGAEFFDFNSFSFLIRKDQLK